MFNLGVCPPLPILREEGPPEQSQRDLQRPSAQPRPSAVPQKNRGRINSMFNPSLPPKPHEHQPGHDFAPKFDRCIPVAAASVGLRGCASPPKRSREQQPPSLCRLKQSADTRGAPGRTLVVVRLVRCQRVPLDLWALFEFW